MKYLLPTAVFLLMVSVGISLKPGELLRHQARLKGWPWLRLLIATFIVPPVIVLLLQRWLPIDFGEAVGLFMIGVVPGAPLMSRNAAKRGFDMQLAASYQVWGALLTPIMIPLVVFATAKLYERDIWIPPGILLSQIVEKQFVPLVIGMLLMLYAAGVARKLQPAITTLGNLLLIFILAAMLWKMRATLAAITPWLAVAAITLAVCSMLAIPLLLRSDPEINKTLALCNANRHVGLALLLAGRYLRARDALPAIACYALVAPLAMLVFVWLVRRKGAAPVAAKA